MSAARQRPAQAIGGGAGVAGLPEIAFVEYLHWHQGRRVKRHSHDDLWQLDYFTSGEGTYRLGSLERRVDLSRVFVVPPGTPHEIASSRERPLVNLTVKFRAGTHEGRVASLPRVVVVDEAASREVAELLRKIVSETVLATDEHELVAALRLTELLILLNRIHAAVSGGVAPNPIVERARRIMIERVSEKVTLDGIARAVGVAGAHLCRVFKRETGGTPFEFLRRVRLENAKGLIAVEGTSVADAAAAAGFGSAQELRRAMKRYEGMSAREYRRQALAGS